MGHRGRIWRHKCGVFMGSFSGPCLLTYTCTPQQPSRGAVGRAPWQGSTPLLLMSPCFTPPQAFPSCCLYSFRHSEGFDDCRTHSHLCKHPCKSFVHVAQPRRLSQPMLLIMLCCQNGGCSRMWIMFASYVPLQQCFDGFLCACA